MPTQILWNKNICLQHPCMIASLNATQSYKKYKKYMNFKLPNWPKPSQSKNLIFYLKNEPNKGLYKKDFDCHIAVKNYAKLVWKYLSWILRELLVEKNFIYNTVDGGVNIKKKEKMNCDRWSGELGIVLDKTFRDWFPWKVG